MAFPADKADELRALLEAFRVEHGIASVPEGAGKAMEAWLVMRLATEAAALPQRTVTLRSSDGTQIDVGAPFRLPAQPRSIPAATRLGADHVLIQDRRNPPMAMELHGSLQWTGRSQARHEYDVSLVPLKIAQAIRENGGGSPRGLPVVALECKDKGSQGKLDEVRQKLGRMFDLALVSPPKGMECRIYEEKTRAAWGRSPSNYRALFGKGAFGIVRSSGFQSGAQSLASHYKIDQFSNIYDRVGPYAALRVRFRDALVTLRQM